MTYDIFLRNVGLQLFPPETFERFCDEHAAHPVIQEYNRLSVALYNGQPRPDALRAMEQFFCTAIFPGLNVPWADVVQLGGRIPLDATTLPHLLEFCRGGQSVLEGGCGTGLTLAYLAYALAPIDVIGADVLPEAVAFASRRIHGFGLQNASVHEIDLSLPPETWHHRFDRVCLRNVFHPDTTSGDDLVRSLQSAQKLLTSTGRIFFSANCYPDTAGHIQYYLKQIAEEARLRVEGEQGVACAKQDGEELVHVYLVLS